MKSKIKEGTSHLALTAELYEVLENLWIASLGRGMRKGCYLSPPNSSSNLSAKRAEMTCCIVLGNGERQASYGYFHPQKWEVATPRRGVSYKGMVSTETESTETSRSIDSPTGCSLSPLADLSQITVTSQWGAGHLQQSQHLIKPWLPKFSPSQASSGTVPIRKATDRFLILFPFPPLDWECLVQQLSSQQLQGELQFRGSRNPYALCRTRWWLGREDWSRFSERALSSYFV